MSYDVEVGDVIRLVRIAGTLRSYTQRLEASDLLNTLPLEALRKRIGRR